MTDHRPSGFVGFLDTVGKVWVLLFGVTGLVLGGVGWGYSITSRVSILETTVTAMLTHNVPSRLQTLEDNQVNTSATATAQNNAVQSQLAAVQTQLHDLTAATSAQSQDISLLKGQMQFVIDQNWPQAKGQPR